MRQQNYAVAAIHLYIHTVACLVTVNNICNKIPIAQFNHFSHNYIPIQHRLKKKSSSKITVFKNEVSSMEYETKYRNLLINNTSEFLEFIGS